MTDMIERVARAIWVFAEVERAKALGDLFVSTPYDSAGAIDRSAMVMLVRAAIAAIREIDRDETLASYSRTDGRREWVSVGAWLHPGEAIVKIDAALAEKDAKS